MGASRAAAASPAHCVAEGAALDEIVAGQEARFTIISYDRMGNRRVGGGDKFGGHLTLRSSLASGAYTADAAATTAATAGFGSRTAERSRGRVGSREAMTLVSRAAMTGIDLPDRGRIRVGISDCGDGSYQGIYRVPNPGAYQLHLELADGGPISGSPFDVTVRRGGGAALSAALAALASPSPPRLRCCPLRLASVRTHAATC